VGAGPGSGATTAWPVVSVDTAGPLTLVNDQIRSITGVTAVEVLSHLRLGNQWQPEHLRADTRSSRARNGSATSGV